MQLMLMDVIGERCKFHVHFHGCGMYFEAIGEDFMLGSGFAEVAVANDIVILFPQVRNRR